jgi:hypothetical protein
VQAVFEIRTYWHGDLLEVAHTPSATEGRREEGPLTVVVERVKRTLPRPLALPADYAFARVLCLTAIVELVLFGAFLLTPKNDLLYVLGDELGTMKSLPGPDWVGHTRHAIFAGPSGTPDGGGGGARRRGPLLRSPPGSRTYQRPEVPKGLLAMLATSKVDSKMWSAFSVSSSGVEGGVEAGVLGTLVGGSIENTYGSGGLGLRGTGRGGGGTGEGVIGLGSVGVIGRGAGGGGVGYGRLGGLAKKRKKRKDDPNTRVVYCKEIVDFVLELMPDDGDDRPSRAALYRTCRSTVGTTAMEGMTCIGKAKDEHDGRIELLLRCGDKLPKRFKDALKKEGMRE